MENTSETRHEYLIVLKHLLQLSDAEALKASSDVFKEMLTTSVPSQDYLEKVNFFRLRNAIQEKVKELEVIALQTPELMNLPILESELLNVVKLEEM